MKKLFLILLVAIVLTSCSSTTKVLSSLELTEEELQSVNLSEGQTAVRVYGGIFPYLETIGEYGSLDKKAKVLKEYDIDLYDYSEIAVFDKFERLLYKNEYQYINPEIDLLSHALFDPESVLDTVIDGEYKINRIFCIEGDNQLGTKETSIHYETTKGDYILFMPLSYYNQELPYGTMYLVPFKEAERKIIEALKAIEPGVMGGDPYCSSLYFEDYKFEYTN